MEIIYQKSFVHKAFATLHLLPVLKAEIRYRVVAVAIMFTAFFAQTFSTSLIIADYYTHTASFARNCENKARPELHCNGKCQMVKQVKAEEKKDQQNSERKDNKNEVFLYTGESPFACNDFSLLASKRYPAFAECKEIKTTRSLLRPPIV